LYQRKKGYQQDLETAGDPQADGRELQKLVQLHYGEAELVRAVARNPACPSQLLLEFYRYAQAWTADNPKIAELLKDNDWRISALIAPREKYSRYGDPVNFHAPVVHKVLWVLEHGENDYKRLVLQLAGLPAEVLRTEARNKNVSMRKTLAARKTLPDDVFELLANDRTKTVRRAVAANPQTPPALLEALLSDADADVSSSALANPQTPQAARRTRAISDRADKAKAKDLGAADFAQLFAWAADVDTDAETLSQLAEHTEPCVRFIVGNHPRLTEASQLKLLAESEAWVTAGLAFNKNITPKVLKQLLSSAKASARDVQLGLAGNPALSEKQQLQLAKTACDVVAEQLAASTDYPSVWDKLVEHMKADPETVKQKKPGKSTGKQQKRADRSWRVTFKEVRDQLAENNFKGLKAGYKSIPLSSARIIARHEQCPGKLSQHFAFYIPRDHKHNPTAAWALLEGKESVKPLAFREWLVDMWFTERRAPGMVANYFIQSDHKKNRTRAVSSPSTLVRHLWPILTDADTNTRKRLAERTDLPRGMYEVLARDTKPGVREFVASNRAAPGAAVALLANDGATTVRLGASKNATGAAKRTGRARAATANQGSATERVRVVKKLKTPKSLDRFVTDRAASVRVALVENEYTDPQRLKELAGDRDAKVRTAVARRCRCKDTMTQLLGDAVVEVRRMAARSRVFYEYEDRDRRYDPVILKRICTDEDAEIRAEGARYADDDAVQQQLATDPSELVTRALVQNKKLASPCLALLAETSDDVATLGEVVRRTDDAAVFIACAKKIGTSRSSASILVRNHALFKDPSVQAELSGPYSKEHSKIKPREVDPLGSALVSDVFSVLLGSGGSASQGQKAYQAARLDDALLDRIFADMQAAEAKLDVKESLKHFSADARFSSTHVGQSQAITIGLKAYALGLKILYSPIARYSGQSTVISKTIDASGQRAEVVVESRAEYIDPETRVNTIAEFTCNHVVEIVGDRALITNLSSIETLHQQAS
jgi:hypothetical protein